MCARFVYTEPNLSRNSVSGCDEVLVGKEASFWLGRGIHNQSLTSIDFNEAEEGLLPSCKKQINLLNFFRRNKKKSFVFHRAWRARPV